MEALYGTTRRPEQAHLMGYLVLLGGGIGIFVDNAVVVLLF